MHLKLVLFSGTSFWRRKSMLTGGTASWYGSCSVWTAQMTARTLLPSLQDISGTYCHREAANIIMDSGHPAQPYFTLYPSHQTVQKHQYSNHEVHKEFLPARNSYLTAAVRYQASIDYLLPVFVTILVLFTVQCYCYLLFIMVPVLIAVSCYYLLMTNH